ncbi:MAG: hypothetical protein OXT74_14100 [Candidatus Poribacteria bacterium]|nr:hypothetical protein [Candidatus Poribacteria bacterium]
MSPTMLVPVFAIHLVLAAVAGGYLFVQHQEYEALIEESLTPEELNEVEKRRPAFEAWEKEAPDNIARRIAFYKKRDPSYIVTEEELEFEFNAEIVTLFSRDTQQAITRFAREGRELTPDEEARLAFDSNVVEALMGGSTDEYVGAAIARFMERPDQKRK